MSLELLRPFYDACHDTIVGSRTGQTGMANNGLARLTGLLTELIDRMPAEDRTEVAPVVNAMLAARSSSDTTALADLIQHELAKALSRTEIAPQLLDPEIIAALRGKDHATEDARPIEHLAENLRTTSQYFNQAQGLSVYHAAPLLARNAHAEAKALIQLENPPATEIPAVGYLLSLTLAHEGNHAEAAAVMEDAYARCPTLRDGFVRIGQMRSTQGDIKGGLAIASQDAATERMTPTWQINLALLHGQAGDFPQAETLIADAYRKEPTIKDGFARLAWIRALQRQWPEAQDLMDRDYHNNTLSPNWQPHLAAIRAHMNKWEAAIQLIETAYALAPALKDANAHLGWHGFLLGKGIQIFHDLIDKDRQAGRFSAAGETFAALYHAIQGDFAQACLSVERHYREYRNAQSQWAVIGWAALKQGDPTLAYELMSRDYQADRLSPAWLPSVALVSACTDNTSLADEVIGKMALHMDAKDIVTIGYRFAPDRILTFDAFFNAFRDSSLTHETIHWRFESKCLPPGSEYCQISSH